MGKYYVKKDYSIPFSEAAGIFELALPMHDNKITRIDAAIGLSAGNFARYRKINRIPLWAYLALKQVVSSGRNSGGRVPSMQTSNQAPKPLVTEHSWQEKPEKAPTSVAVNTIDKEELMGLIAMATGAGQVDLVIKLAKML